MDAIECIRTRMSIRAFRREPVPREVLTEVFEAAMRSPSYKNSQPWEVIVLSGDRKEALSEMMVGLLERGASPCPDMPEPVEWPAAERARITRLYSRRAEATGIDLRDPAVVRKAKKVNFRFYGAPHAVYLLQDSSLSPWSILDMGLFAQSFMLAAHARGLGTVPQAFATDYAGEIKQFLSLPETKRILLGLSVGYPDWESPANSLRTDRSGVEEIVTWLE